MARRQLNSLLLALGLCIGTGCTTVTYTDKDVTFKRTSFLTSLKIKSIKKTKDGGLVIEGYGNDQIEGVSMLVEAAVKGAVKGAK